MEQKDSKFGFWSIVLLGINAIVGTGIFLLPNKAYALMGPASLGVLLFDAFLAICIALCFAEVAGFFTRNGGPYLYAKHSLGDFWGFEVGVLKWIVHRLGSYGSRICDSLGGSHSGAIWGFYERCHRHDHHRLINGD